MLSTAEVASHVLQSAEWISFRDALCGEAASELPDGKKPGAFAPDPTEGWLKSLGRRAEGTRAQAAERSRVNLVKTAEAARVRIQTKMSHGSGAHPARVPSHIQPPFRREAAKDAST
jgi:hypothetical protein